MISENNLREAMNNYVSKGDLLTKELNSLGFTNIDLTRLVHNKSILERIKKGYYKVSSNELFEYAKTQIDANDLEKAFSILYRCCLDDSENIEYVYNLFMVSVLTEKYDVAITCIRKLLNDKSNTYQDSDINYYFLILGLSVNLPDELVSMFKYIQFEDIQVLTGDKNKDIPVNRLRRKVIDGSFKNIEIPNDENSLEFKVQNKLINLIIDKQFVEKSYIFDLVKDKKLYEALEYLSNNLSYRNLSNVENYYLKIINSYFEIERTKKMPIVRDLSSSSVWEAIDNNNFRTAFRMQKEYCTENGLVTCNNLLYLLLLEVNEMIDAVKSLNEDVTEVKSDMIKLSKDDKTEVQQVVQEHSEDELSNEKSEATLYLILETLLNNDIDKACDYVQIYLNDREEYAYIANYLIKISIYEKDVTFSKPLMAISMIKSNSFEFVVSEYVLRFYESLAKRQFEVAGVYLDILNKAKEKGHTKFVVKGMKEVLDNAIEESKNKLKRFSYDFVSNDSPSYSFEDLNTGYSFEEFTSRGILVLDYNKFGISEAIPVIQSLSYIDSFVIEYDGYKKVVLRYKDNKNVNSQDFISNLLSSGEVNFAIGKYFNALAIYKNILQKSFAPNSSLYYRIGLIFFKLEKMELAKDYFMVASALSKIENINNINSDIIDTVLNNDVIEESMLRVSDDLEQDGVETDVIQKPVNSDVYTIETSIQSEDKKRQEEVFNYYGFDIDKVVDLVVNAKMSLSDACDSLNFAEEEYLKAALYIAREYYYLGDIKSGNKYFNIVQASKNRSKTIETFYKQVKINKKFYHKGELEGPRLRLK